MQIIGITGGIGAGKSTVLQILKTEYNGFVVEADKLAHQLMEPGQNAYNRIVEAFGTDILGEDGKICRPALSAKVFSDEQKLNRLNSIVHPEVKQWIQAEIQRREIDGVTRYFIIEAALLIEDGYQSICDEIWYIYAPEEVRIQRLMESRGYDLEKCQSIIRNQSTDAFYRENSSAVIENGAMIQSTQKQIQELLKRS